MVRVSVAGVAGSLKRYAVKEATGGPIVTRLSAGHLLSGRLVAGVPLGDGNTPTVALEREKSGDRDPAAGPVGQARVAADGSFAFRGLADGKYTLRLHPAHAAEPPSAGPLSLPAAGETSGEENSPANKPWQRPVVIHGGDVRLEAIDLHAAGMLPGRLTMLAFQPTSNPLPFANAFVSLWAARATFDPSDARLSGMTDAGGRFQPGALSAGQVCLAVELLARRASNRPCGSALRPRRRVERAAVRSRVPAEDQVRRRRRFGADVYAAAAIDADAPPKKGGGQRARGRATPWRNRARRRNGPRGCRRDQVRAGTARRIDRLLAHLPGELRLRAAGTAEAARRGPRDSERRAGPLETEAQEFRRVADDADPRFHVCRGAARVAVECRPPRWSEPSRWRRRSFGRVAAGNLDRVHRRRRAGPRRVLPTRTCTTHDDFRFIGLAPGKYSLRISTKEETFQPVEASVEKGKDDLAGPNLRDTGENKRIAVPRKPLTPSALCR